MDTAELEQRVFAEQRWIAALREAGYRLTNATSGGEGPHLYKPTGQTRRRHSEANKRRFANNPVEREFYRQQMIRLFGGEDGRRYLSEKATAQWAVPGAREAQSERLKAICSDPEFTEKRGRVLSHMLLETERGEQIRNATSRRLSGEGNHFAKLTWSDVREIRAKYAAGGITQTEIAAEHGVEPSLISQIIRHKIWVDDTGQSVPPPVPRKVYPRVTNDQLAELALVYRAALPSRQPGQAVARHFDISPNRASGWIAKARERGLLGATTPGVAGEAQ
jgi:transposase-like protein